MSNLKAFLIIVSVMLGLSISAQTSIDKPNILFIMADDCTFRDIGCYGGQARTPNIDGLAKEGMRFTRCFQAAPMFSPTRHNLYTGLYPVKSGAYCNHTFANDDVKSIVHYLKPLGYRVALTGKTHINPKSVFPLEYSAGKKGESAFDMAAVNDLMKDSKKNGRPFALFACSTEPHAPWNKGKEYASHYDPDSLKLRPYMVDTRETRSSYRDYLCEITYFDNEVGLLLKTLEKQGLADNTLVMVVSEQGNNFPFAKWTCYDSGLQSIMVVRWPGNGKVKPGSETDAMVEYVDVCPTFVEAAGGTPAPVLDGKSLLPVLFGQTNKHKQQVFGIQTSRGIYGGPHDYPIRSVRNEKYKLILNLDADAKFFNSIDRQKWFKTWKEMAEAGDAHAKAMVERYYHRPAVELYDVTKDSYEMHNLAANPEYVEVIKDMRATLEGWMQSQGDKGLETEMHAFERMTSGNAEYKEWAKKNRPADSKKKEKEKQ